MELFCVSQSLKIHHIGYLVKNIEKSQALFTAMGYMLEQSPIYDEYRDVDICFLSKDGYRIELVAPRTSKSVVGELRKKIGNSPYHICYEVENLEEAVTAFRKNHFVIWEEAHVAPALAGKRVAFLINGQMGMIELLEI